MRRSFSSIFRLVAAFLVMTIMTSGVAMAAYVCPDETALVLETVIEDMPCGEMDMEKPVQCAEYQSGVDLALEHLAAAPSLSPLIIYFVIPAPVPVIPKRLASFIADIGIVDGATPPYLQTLRLRI